MLPQVDLKPKVPKQEEKASPSDGPKQQHMPTTTLPASFMHIPTFSCTIPMCMYPSSPESSCPPKMLTTTDYDNHHIV